MLISLLKLFLVCTLFLVLSLKEKILLFCFVTAALLPAEKLKFANVALKLDCDFEPNVNKPINDLFY